MSKIIFIAISMNKSEQIHIPNFNLFLSGPDKSSSVLFSESNSIMFHR